MTFDQITISQLTPEAQATKFKIDKLGFIKVKDFSAAKDTIKKGKTAHRMGEMFINSISDKGSVSRIYKNAYTQ